MFADLCCSRLEKTDCQSVYLRGCPWKNQANSKKKWQSQFPRISLFLFKTIDFPSETNTMKSKIQ